MPSLDVYNTKAQKTSTTKVSDKLFAAKINSPLMTQAVKVYLSNQRQAPAQTKSRGEIVVSKRKIWRQKGTGRARHGSRNAPIFVGGAKAHGPTGEQNYKLKLTRKMKQLSLFSALTQQFKAKNILVLTDLDKLQPQTKIFHKLFKKLVNQPQKLVLLLSQPNQTIKRATNNLPYLTTTLATNLNTYQALNAHKLIFTKESLKALEKHYLK
jgi:large subunit ribosomal protein L4